MNERVMEEGRKRDSRYEAGKGKVEEREHCIHIPLPLSYHVRSCLTLFFSCWANDRPDILS